MTETEVSTPETAQEVLELTIEDMIQAESPSPPRSLSLRRLRRNTKTSFAISKTWNVHPSS